MLLNQTLKFKKISDMKPQFLKGNIDLFINKYIQNHFYVSYKAEVLSVILIKYKGNQQLLKYMTR